MYLALRLADKRSKCERGRTALFCSTRSVSIFGCRNNPSFFHHHRLLLLVLCMASWLFRRPRTLVHHLKRQVGLWGVLDQFSGLHGFPPAMPPFKSSSIPRATERKWRPCPVFSAKRFESTKAEKQEHLDEEEEEEDGQVLDFPGGKVSFNSKMQFIPRSPETRIPCYQVLNDYGQPMDFDCFVQVNEELAVKIYTKMVTLQMMDAVFYEAQRQGRISFYLTSTGEEAVNVASAAALMDDDVVLPQYREQGVLLWRGFTLQEFANQCFGNKVDYGKGRQMPIHYGSNKHNYFTVSSPISTQLPQAVGAAYSLKMDKKSACVVAYCGDGGTSEGDFHAGLNFAAVMEAPVIFICRNNGWAISTHVGEQFRSDGIVVRGQAYGIHSIRVDGNDALAVYTAVLQAREMAVKEHKPILIEALTYRVGHHSTSDDSTKYRPIDEIEYWKNSRNPVNRFRKWVERNQWWDDKREAVLRSNVRKQVLQAIQSAEKYEKPPLSDLFTDVYDIIPANLHEQETQLKETIKRYPKDYPYDVPV